MSDLFGAPSGIIASDQNIRQNVLSGLAATETLGKIGMQPIQANEMAARARLFGAEATEKETAARAQQSMLDLQAGFARDEAERRARGQLVEQGKAAGVDATVADIPQGGLVNQSQAAPLERFAQYARDHGAPPMLLEKTDAAIAGIREKEAIAAYRTAQAGEIQFKQQTQKFTQLGNIAGTASQSPQSYMAVLSNPQMRAMLPPNLTGNFATDKPILEAVMNASQDSIKRLNLEREMQDDRSKQARRSAASKKDDAIISRAQAQTDLVRQRLDNLKKNGGESSPSVVKAREDLERHRQEVDAAKIRKEFPPVPLDPKARSFVQTYTAADGKTRFMWDKDPVTGQGVARRVTGPTAAKGAAPAARPAAEEPDNADEQDEPEED